MANLTGADLDSPMVDLTTIPLAELRDLSTSALVEALERTYVLAASNSGNELQDQRN
jgi:hypothetical protein